MVVYIQSAKTIGKEKENKMKQGSRVFTDNSKMTSVEGNTTEFKQGCKVEVEVISRREGLCKIAGIEETYKCKAVRGRTSLV